jgi:hypothetical protein
MYYDLTKEMNQSTTFSLSFGPFFITLQQVERSLFCQISDEYN